MRERPPVLTTAAYTQRGIYPANSRRKATVGSELYYSGGIDHMTIKQPSSHAYSYKLGGAGRPPRALRAHVSSWLRSIGLRGSASLYCIHSLLWREHSYINYAYACFIIHDSEAPHAHMVHTLRHCVVLSFAEQGRTASAFCALLSHK